MQENKMVIEYFYPRRVMHHDGPRLSSIGTTAEIFSIKNETDEPTGISTVRVKATGRQRFEIKETRRTVDGYGWHYLDLWGVSSFSNVILTQKVSEEKIQFSICELSTCMYTLHSIFYPYFCLQMPVPRISHIYIFMAWKQHHS